MTVHVLETIWWNRVRAIELENEFVQVVIFPEKGCEIHRFYGKSTSMDYLYIYEDETQRFRLDTESGKIKPLENYFFGGLYTMFPNAGAFQKVEERIYDFHGDLRKAAWSYEIEGTDAEVVIYLVASSVNTPLNIKRSIRFKSGSTVLHVEDSLYCSSHVGPNERIPYIYGVHPYHSNPFLAKDTLIRVEGREFKEKPVWEQAVNKISYFQSDLVGSIEIYNPTLATGIRFSFDPGFMKHVWLWFHHEPGLSKYVNAIIPCTSSGDQGISGAIDNGTIRYLMPSEIVRTKWSLEII